MSATASILIRTKNEQDFLSATLDAVYKQTVPPHEVLIIDSGSKDATLAVASRFPVRTLHISPEGWTYPRALNFGANHATGEILVCLSAHCRPLTDEWLSSLLRHFDDPTVAAVWGPEHPDVPSNPSDAPRYQEPGAYGAEYRFWGLSNANSALRRSIWLELPFDEALPGGEDKAWGRDVLARGHRIVYEPAAAVWHEPHKGWSAFQRDRAAIEGFKMTFPELQGLKGFRTTLKRAITAQGARGARRAGGLLIARLAAALGRGARSRRA